jgi:hypothetical protein
MLSLRKNSDSKNVFTSSLCNFQSTGHPCIYIIGFGPYAFPINSLLTGEKAWTTNFNKHYISFHLSFNIRLDSEECVCTSTPISLYVKTVISKWKFNGSTIFHTDLQESSFMHVFSKIFLIILTWQLSLYLSQEKKDKMILNPKYMIRSTVNAPEG